MNSSHFTHFSCLDSNLNAWFFRTTSQPADTSPFKPQRGSTAAPSPASPGTRQPNVYPPYQSGTAPVSREAQAMRYLQSSPYTAPVPYRDVPSHYRSQVRNGFKKKIILMRT